MQLQFKTHHHLFSFNSWKTVITLWKCVHFQLIINEKACFFCKVRDSMKDAEAFDKWHTPYLLCSLCCLQDPVSGTDKWEEEQSALPECLYACVRVDGRCAASREALTHNGFEIAVSGRWTHHSPEYKAWRIQTLCSYSSHSPCTGSLAWVNVDRGSNQCLWSTDVFVWLTLTENRMCRGKCEPVLLVVNKK